MGGGDPGLAGAGGAENDDLGLLRSAEIDGLRRIERLDGRKNTFGFELGTLKLNDLSGNRTVAAALFIEMLTAEVLAAVCCPKPDSLCWTERIGRLHAPPSVARRN